MKPDRPASFLPVEIIPSARPREMVLTWLFTIAIVLALNIAIAPRMLEGGRNLAGWIITHKWRILLRLDQPVDDLILGDSSCNQGVDPRVLAESLGDRSAVNLCTIGDMLALNDAWMLQAYLERHRPPKRVFIVHVYDIWARDFDWSRIGTVPLGFLDLRRLQPAVRLERWQLRSYLETRYFPLYASNLSLQARLRVGDPALGEFPSSRRLDSLGFLGDSVAYPDSVERDYHGHRGFLAKERFTLSDDNARGLRRIAELAETHRMEVYLVQAPVFEGLAADPAFRRYLGDVEHALAKVTGPRVKYLFNQPMAFPATQMQNADHLVAGAAETFTRAIAKEVMKAE